MNDIEIKENLRKAKVEAFLDNMLPQEQVTISIGRTRTAHWAFLPPHNIVVGNADYLMYKTKNHIQGLLFHELSHAMWTDKNRETILKQLKKYNINFSLYNVFEDARIEEKYRQYTGKKFNWIADIPNGFPILPLEYFQVLINNEGKYPVIEKKITIKLQKFINTTSIPIFTINDNGFCKEDTVKMLLERSGYRWCEFVDYNRNVNKPITEPKTTKTVKNRHGYVKLIYKDTNETVYLTTYTLPENNIEFQHGQTSLELPLLNEQLADEVYEFYKETINCKSSMEVIEVCKKWKDKYGNDSGISLNEYQNDRMLDSLQILEDKHIRYKLTSIISSDIEENNDVKSSDNINNSGNINSKPQELSQGYQYSCSNNLTMYDFIDNKVSIFNETELNKLTILFKRIIKQGMVKYNSTIPSKRINIRNYSLGYDKIFKKSVNDNGKNEEIAVILDCSGSMLGEHINEGKKLLLILNRLAKQGMIKGNIVLTHSKGQAVIPMPISDENIIKSIRTFGGEGFATCIKKTTPILKKASKIFVFTDGLIGDIPDENYNRSLGIKLWGLYVGERNQRNELLKFFDYGISETTLEDVIMEMLKQVK